MRNYYDTPEEIEAYRNEQQAEKERQRKHQKANAKAVELTTQKLVLGGTLTDEEIQELVYLYPAWKVGIEYKVDDLCEFQGNLYQVLQAHTSQADWTPDVAVSLFVSHAPEGVIPEWVQPTGAHDAYNTGDKVMFEGQVYESLIDGNTWSPADYPQGWQLVE